MRHFNKNALPDKNATSTYPDGGYCFTCITPEENEEIVSILDKADKLPPDQQGVALAFYSESTIYKPHYIIDQIIIEFVNGSTYPLDRLAEFIAYSRKGSAFRQNAINSFEEYEKVKINVEMPSVNSCITAYSSARLYLMAAEIYEKEYQFEKALHSVEKSCQNGWNKVVCIKRYSEILAKIDIDKAVEFLQTRMSDDPILSDLSNALDEMKVKAAKGYKFKPKRKVVENNLEMEQQIRQLAYRYIIKE